MKIIFGKNAKFFIGNKEVVGVENIQINLSCQTMAEDVQLSRKIKYPKTGELTVRIKDSIVSCEYGLYEED